MTNYKITKNLEFNSIEVYFEGMPTKEERERMKAAKMRWHGKNRYWYGFMDEKEFDDLMNGKKEAKEKSIKMGDFEVKIGDWFVASWGYEQTNVDYFQVVDIVGKKSVRVIEASPVYKKEDACGPMSCDRTVYLTKEIQPGNERSIFIKDHVKGDLKRLTSYSQDQHPQFRIDSFASAYYVGSEKENTQYVSWYY